MQLPSSRRRFPRQVCGIMNGTTNFMLSKMESEGADYGEVLKEAQDLGYAEGGFEFLCLVCVDALLRIRIFGSSLAKRLQATLFQGNALGTLHSLAISARAIPARTKLLQEIRDELSMPPRTPRLAA